MKVVALDADAESITLYLDAETDRDRYALQVLVDNQEAMPESIVGYGVHPYTGEPLHATIKLTPADPARSEKEDH